MYARHKLVSAALITLAVSTGAVAEVGYPPPQPLSAWLSERVVFVGVGQISNLTVDPSTGYASFTLTLVEAWKGTAPRTVSFARWPFGHTGLSEGVRMVYYAFSRKFTHSKTLGYVSPEPVFHSGGRDCFVFGYAEQAVPPENTIAFRWQGRAKEQGLAPILLFAEFRAAVLAAVK